MLVQNEENKTSSTWRNQKSRHLELDGDGDTGVRSASGSSRGQSLRVCGENRQGENTSVESERTDVGGAIDELVANIIEQLADSENRTEKLKSQLEKIRSIRQQIESSGDFK